MVEARMGDVLRMAHTEESAVQIGSAEPTFRWNFYVMSIDKAVAKHLVPLPESGILSA